jgi:hypothetical protein
MDDQVCVFVLYMETSESFAILLPLARLNSLMFYLIWALAPILLSTISFLTFVMLGNELTIGTAFTVRPSLPK